MATPARVAARIFVSYSHKDRRQKEKIVDALQSLHRDGLAELWSDQRISLGASWDEEIRTRIEQSDIALVLVSTEFLNSPYCRRVEIAKFLELRRNRGLRIVPVILFDCDWKNEPWLAATQAYPGGDRTLFGHHRGRAAMASALQGLLERVRAAIGEAAEARTPPAPPVVAPTLAPVTVARETPVEERLTRLFDRDPVVNRAAADEWIAARVDDFDALGRKVGGMHPLNVLSVRRVCAADPRATAPMLQTYVFHADDDWRGAQGAAEAFGPAHRDFSAAAMGQRLRDDTSLHPDIGRNCITALGQMVASSWGPELLQALRGPMSDAFGDYLTSSYIFEKYHSYVIAALAKFVAGARATDDAFYALARLADAIEFADGYSSGGEFYRDDAVRTVFATCTAAQADEIVRRWTAHANAKLRRFAAYALGHMRLARMERELEQMLSDAEPAVAGDAAVALANTGTATSAETLVRRKAPSFALALALSHVPDRATALQLGGRFLEESSGNERWLALRAAGVRGLTELLPAVERQLLSRNGAERGSAALALVRLDPRKFAPRVRRAWEEAGEPLERVLMTLAVVAAGQPLQEEEQQRFRADLCSAGFFMRPIKEDLLQILGASGSAELAQIAAAWKPLYDLHADY